MRFLHYCLRRNYTHTKKNLMIMALIAFPIVELMIILYSQMTSEALYYAPDFAAMVADFADGSNKMIMLLASRVYFFLMPLILLGICSDDCIDDAQSHFQDMLVTRVGKRTYVKTQVIKSFVMGFCCVFASLGINLLLSHILFRGAQFNGISVDYYHMNRYWTLMLAHPTITDSIFIIVFAFVSGCSAMIGTMIALLIPKRKFVYAITFAIWCIWIYMPDSMNNIVRPYLLTTLSSQLRSFLIIVITTVIVLVVGYRRFTHEKTSC